MDTKSIVVVTYLCVMIIVVFLTIGLEMQREVNNDHRRRKFFRDVIFNLILAVNLIMCGFTAWEISPTFGFYLFLLLFALPLTVIIRGFVFIVGRFAGKIAYVLMRISEDMFKSAGKCY